ncbi:MAG TPA: hypothetical protein VGK20_07440 [Candidatus Binatia bacterium]|jgi:hypothetical protein
MSSVGRALRENFVLVVGLVLPVLLMVGFLAASSLTQGLVVPPKYDLVFAVQDYAPAAQNLPIGLRLVVKDHVLVAQYAKLTTQRSAFTYGAWKKLYIYEASLHKVRELALGIPADAETIDGTREEVVEATRDLRLDTTIQSPDGYEISSSDTSHGGLITSLFWDSYNRSRVRLRSGSSSVPLELGDGHSASYPGNVEFVGWVVPDAKANS